MKAIAISNKRHSMYTYAIAQLSFDTKAKFDAAFNYMDQVYGKGIYHDRHQPFVTSAYSRNTGDNRVWYYTDIKRRRYGRDVADFKIYLTTPDQITMASLFG